MVNLAKAYQSFLGGHDVRTSEGWGKCAVRLMITRQKAPKCVKEINSFKTNIASGYFPSIEVLQTFAFEHADFFGRQILFLSSDSILSRLSFPIMQLKCVMIAGNTYSF